MSNSLKPYHQRKKRMDDRQLVRRSVAVFVGAHPPHDAVTCGKLMVNSNKPTEKMGKLKIFGIWTKQ